MAARSEEGTLLDGVLDATVDTILALASVWLFVFTVVVRTEPLVGLSPSEPVIQIAIGILAIGCTYPFVTGLWPLGQWLRFLVTGAGLLLASSFVAFFVLVPIGGIPTNSVATELLQFGIFAVALAGAGAVSVLRDR